MIKIISSTWHNTASGECMGVVAIQSFKDTWKAYVGVGKGSD